MKRCLNCRRTYDDKLTRCPFCGYRPRTKTNTNTNININNENTKTVRHRSDDRSVIDSGRVLEYDVPSESTVVPHSAPIQKKPEPKPQPQVRPLPKTQYAGPEPDPHDIYSYSHNVRVNRSIGSNSPHVGEFYLQSGEMIDGRYSVMNVMGFGAFGVAYECFDSHTRSNVVVKEYFPSFTATRSRRGRDIEAMNEQSEASFEIGIERFIDENQKLLDNDVRCVPMMKDCFRENNTSYVVTELVRGEALSSIIRRKGKLPYQGTINIITGVLQGLRQLNRLGIIHGDICPENIIVTNDGNVYLLDYNLSDFNRTVYTQKDIGKLRAGYSALELYYLNMEQGPWSDVYAAAAVMYKMMTGITIPSSIKRKTNDTLTPPSKLGVQITQGAEKAMLKALRVDYEKRTQNPEDFLNGLTGDGFEDMAIAKSSGSSSSGKAKAYTDYNRRDSKDHLVRALTAAIIFIITAIIGVIIFIVAFNRPDHNSAKKNVSSSVSSSVSSMASGTDTETETDTDTDTATESDSETETETELESEPESESESESETEFESVLESEQYSEPESEFYSEPESEQYSEPESEFYSESESESYSESKTETEYDWETPPKTDEEYNEKDISSQFQDFFTNLYDQATDAFNNITGWLDQMNTLS